MRQSEENIRKIEDAAINGKYQIVCRQVFGSLNSWYITNNPTTEWNWSFNEYRVYVGCNEPPMTNKMNDYSVYYCGYNYYFLEGGAVKKQVNVNVAQDCESAPYFKSNHILSDKITPLENGNVEIENLRVDGLKANEIFTDKVTSLKGDTVSIGQNLTVDGNLTVKDGHVRAKKFFANEENFSQSNGIPFGTFGAGITEGRLYANGVAFVSPGTDAAWIRHYDSSTNQGVLELAVGDDTDETIVCKQYNTSGQPVHAVTIMDAYGNSTFNSISSNRLSSSEIIINNKTLLDFVHPIGSYYWSADSTSPNLLFGGNWERIKSRFIYAAGDYDAIGATGGEASHTLTEDEMPSHNHTSNSQSNTSTGFTQPSFTGNQQTGYFKAQYSNNGLEPDGNIFRNYGYGGNNNKRDAGSGGSSEGIGFFYTPTGTVENHAHEFSHTHTTDSKGGSNAHNNMPPYLTAYCWKRIS